MRKRNAPSRSQGREEKMQGASFFAPQAFAVNDEEACPAPAQRSRRLQALRCESLIPLEARRLLDVLHPAARVMELRRDGYNIVTVWATDTTPEGNPHRVARYILRGGGV